ncbi:hypothetical protein EVAR_28225_1 [Eumeta japonica]|uniref:Uncharacterized protein n=1 Tax=Eumeta variegata TaxID=151549 RepID=A0A4C1V708_EUMVA|nr:hypothetical protein EVAR_28225_1 [Eumeta japonica]
MGGGDPLPSDGWSAHLPHEYAIRKTRFQLITCMIKTNRLTLLLFKTDVIVDDVGLVVKNVVKLRTSNQKTVPEFEPATGALTKEL